MNTKRIFNIDLLNITQSSLLQQFTKGVMYTPNVDHLVRLQKDFHFYNVYKNADWIICDSNIVYWSLKFLGTPIAQVIPGSSFFSSYCQFHKFNDDVRIFLLGAAPGVAQTALFNINKKIGRKIVVGAHSPSYGFENDEDECEYLIDLVNQSGATVLAVGVGAPKQEKWIDKYRYSFDNINLFMAIGATIDFESGNVKRAPKYFQAVGFEWFYRLLQDPKRLVKRYLIDDLPFFYYLIRQRLGFYENPFPVRSKTETELESSTTSYK